MTGRIAAEGSDLAGTIEPETAEQRVQTLLNYMLDQEVNHKEKLSAMLHDNALQFMGLSLARLKDFVENRPQDCCRELMQIKGYLESGIEEIRRVMESLFPSSLGAMDINLAIFGLVRQLEKDHIRICCSNAVPGQMMDDKMICILAYRFLERTARLLAEFCPGSTLEIKTLNKDADMRISLTAKQIEAGELGSRIKKDLQVSAYGVQLCQWGCQITTESDSDMNFVITLIIPV